MIFIVNVKLTHLQQLFDAIVSIWIEISEVMKLPVSAIKDWIE